MCAMRLKDLIRQYREEHGLSVAKFAGLAGVSRAYISLLERGTDSRTGKPIYPSVNTLRNIAYAMGTTFDHLIELLDGDQIIAISADHAIHEPPAEFERELLSIYRNLSPEGRAKVYAYALDMDKIDATAFDGALK